MISPAVRSFFFSHHHGSEKMNDFCWMVTAIGCNHLFTSMMGGRVGVFGGVHANFTGILGCPWYLGSIDYFTPIGGCIRPVNR